MMLKWSFQRKRETLPQYPVSYKKSSGKWPQYDLSKFKILTRSAILFEHSGVMKRNHTLDLTRAILLLIGIPYHVCCLYLASEDWIIDSGQPSVGATVIASLSHAFRMQAFFILAGFFALMVVERRGWTPWIKDRGVRLLVPAIVATLTIGMAGKFLVALDLSGDVEVALQSLWKPPYFPIGHMWFLFTLAEICVLFYLFRRLALQAVDLFLGLCGFLQDRLPAVALILIATVVIAGLGFVPAVVIRLSGNGAIGEFLFRILLYLPFFFLGVASFRSPDFFKTIFTPSPTLLIAGLLAEVAFVAFTTYDETQCLAGANCSSVIRAVGRGLSMVSGLFVSIAVFGLIGRIKIRSSYLLSYVVAGSLVMYLFHMPYVLAFGYGFKSVDLPVPVEILAITIMTFASLFLTFEIVRRVPLLSFLFNGSPIRLSNPPQK